MRKIAAAFRMVLVVIGGAVAMAGCNDPVEPSAEVPPELIAFSSHPPGASEAQAREIFVIRPDGSGETQLTFGMAAFAPAWSPDGTMIAFASLAHLGGDGNIYVMNADGTGLRAVTTGAGERVQPTWSPDGEQIAFTALESSERLYSMGVDGADPTLLLDCEFGCQWPAWSPDGSRIAVVSWSPVEGSAGRNPQVHWMQPHDPNLRHLTEGFHYGHQPTWASDGSTLLILGGREDPGVDVYAITPSGAVVSRLTYDGMPRSSPGYSRDGSKIVYYRHSDPAGIYVMESTGGESESIRRFQQGHSMFPTPRWRP